MISSSEVLDLGVSYFHNENLFCEGCVHGKQHRYPFSKNESNRARYPGESFHADLCGKMSLKPVGD